MSRSSSSESKSCNRGHWRPAEDERLKQLVEQYGPQNWNFVAEHLDGRSGKSCRLRWYNQLDPNIVKRPFTEEEEEILLALHKVKGNKWAAISRFLPGRTDNAVKNHFHVLMARRKRERYALLGDRSSSHTVINHNHIPMLDSTTRRPASGINNFTFQNNRNMGIFDMSSSCSLLLNPWNTQSGTSTITSELVNFEPSGSAKPHNDHSSASSPASCSLSSYISFTAPGIPSIGKVVPLPHRFSKSYNNAQRTDDFSIKGMADKITLEEQVEKLKGVSFIDFLGVGSCSASDS
ncbi:transcription factor MYB54 [Prosopis cineraria]|uniref:transcription factor MYB54 n=1 Tax=Prosopis cineraria TaxID=364024 RepID=UPI00240F5508|nr:transcription factor MYB54 [Prosopis cineraria]